MAWVAQAKAQRIIGEELRRLGWQEADFGLTPEARPRQALSRYPTNDYRLSRPFIRARPLDGDFPWGVAPGCIPCAFQAQLLYLLLFLFLFLYLCLYLFLFWFLLRCDPRCDPINPLINYSSINSAEALHLAQRAARHLRGLRFPPGPQVLR